MPFSSFFVKCFVVLLLISSCGTKHTIFTTDSIDQDSLQKVNAPEIKKEISPLNNHIFQQNIRTLLCHQKEEELSLPILQLNGDEKLLVSFDDLGGNVKSYFFTIRHCNRDWTPSELMSTDYIQGFTKEYIDNYQLSFNTLQKYIHYQFEFPSENMQPLLSGNYLFQILDENENLVAQKRFMVLDTKLSVEASVKRATIIEDRNTKQEIDFTIKHPELDIADPFADITVRILQNNQEHSAITNLKPLFVKDKELIYEYESENVFWGNNEYRHFDIKSLRYQSDRIHHTEQDSGLTHIYLFTDNKRSFNRYSTEPDINGNFIIKSQEGWNSAIEADYAMVHFFLSSELISYGNIYLFGSFSEWQTQDEFRLKFNSDKVGYQTEVLLKQGYYNYHYALLDTVYNQIDVSFLEGSHYQTKNEYYIYVYYRSNTDRYDRLVGFQKISSKELF